MDNFFEILIYLIIIISFLSSFFKKKEPEQKRGNNQPLPKSEPTDYTDTKIETKTEESYDILKELENIFKENMGVPAPKPEQENKTVIQQREEEKFQEAYGRNFDKEDVRRVSAESRAIKSRDDLRKLDEKTLREAEKFEELLKYQSELKKMKHPIIDKLHNPQLLKDYVLISEILGKPVAYKR
ncbi:MAG: hypothetical protein K6T54_07445 [Ignavibacterium sp.]|nr:hypothetical protein [Ignavibacterium sp.]